MSAKTICHYIHVHLKGKKMALGDLRRKGKGRWKNTEKGEKRGKTLK
jgi:hypothetical protein